MEEVNKAGERLARLEEQVNGVRTDLVEVKAEIKDGIIGMRDALIEAMNKMPEIYVPRREIERMADLRDEQIKELKDEVSKLEGKIHGLTVKVYWILGGIAVVGVLITALSNIIKL